MRKTYIFGAGAFFERHRDVIEKEFDIDGILDNKIEKGTICFYQDTRLVLCNPADVLIERDIEVIIMVKSYVQIYYQLLELGVKESNIQVGILLFPESEVEKNLAERGKFCVDDKRMYYKNYQGFKILICNQTDIDDYAQVLYREDTRKNNKAIRTILDLSVEPVSKRWGIERGKPVDRYYIERFLEENKYVIKGDVLEIADNMYTLKYGENRINKSYILHVEGWGENAFKGNLETGEGIEENKYDTVIITQTLMFIYDLPKVAANIYKMLKKDGVALITVAGISQVSREDEKEWGHFYSLYPGAMERLFESVFGKENVEINSYGNVKTATAFLYGLCCEDLTEVDYQYNDSMYPVIVSVLLRK